MGFQAIQILTVVDSSRNIFQKNLFQLCHHLKKMREIELNNNYTYNSQMLSMYGIYLPYIYNKLYPKGR